MNLYHATRDDLIPLVLTQWEALAERDRRIAALEAEGATQRPLCERIEKHLADLFVFVEDPAVPSTTPRGYPAAERSLRHLEVSRKISGSTRSAAGSTTKMRLASLFGTWRAQGLNPFDECRTLLATHKSEQLPLVGYM